MPKFVVYVLQTECYWSEARNKQEAINAVLDVANGRFPPKNTRVKQDLECSDNPEISTVFTFEESFGEDYLPNW